MTSPTLLSFLEQKNAAEVVQALYLEHEISRARISLLTGIARSTASTIVDKLHLSGLVQNVREVESPTVGRPPVNVRFSPEALFAVGVELNLGICRIMLVGIDGSIRESEELPTRRGDRPDHILSVAADRVDQVVSRGMVEKDRVAGIGVSFRGLVDREEGLVQRSTSLPEWEGINLAEPFCSRIGLPTFVENNANSMVLGEARFGVARDKKHVFGITIEEGIGGGILIDGKIYLGGRFAAGEFGHMVVLSSGPTCHCGNRGCLRTLASESALEATAIRIAKMGMPTLLTIDPASPESSITIGDIVSGAEQGDNLCQSIISEGAEYLTTGIVNVINLLSPELIVFGQGTLTSHKPFLDEVRAGIEKRAYSRRTGVPEIATASLAERAVCVGAAATVFDRLLVGQ